VLAEGIETSGQLSLLAVEGCDEVQGFLLGRPAALSDIIVNGRVLDGKTWLKAPAEPQLPSPRKTA